MVQQVRWTIVVGFPIFLTRLDLKQYNSNNTCVSQLQVIPSCSNEFKI